MNNAAFSDSLEDVNEESSLELSDGEEQTEAYLRLKEPHSADWKQLSKEESSIENEEEADSDSSDSLSRCSSDFAEPKKKRR